MVTLLDFLQSDHNFSGGGRIGAGEIAIEGFVVGMPREGYREGQEVVSRSTTRWRGSTLGSSPDPPDTRFQGLLQLLFPMSVYKDLLL